MLYIGDKSYFKSKYPNLQEVTSCIQITTNQLNLFSTNNNELLYCGDDILNVEPQEIKGSICLLTIDKRSKLYKYFSKLNKVECEPEVTDQLVNNIFPGANTNLFKGISYSSLLKIKTQYDLINNPTVNDLKWLVSNTNTDCIFECIEQLLNKNVGFFTLYNYLIGCGESKFKILVMVKKRVQQLIQVYNYKNADINEIVSKTGINYYGVKNSLVLVFKYNLVELITIYNKCNNVEVGIKEGLYSELIDIDNLFISIFHKENIYE